MTQLAATPTAHQRYNTATHHLLFILLQIDLGLVGQEGTGPDSALAVVLLAVVLVGVLDGLSQGAIFADAAALPPQYTHVSSIALHVAALETREAHMAQHASSSCLRQLNPSSCLFRATESGASCPVQECITMGCAWPSQVAATLMQATPAQLLATCTAVDICLRCRMCCCCYRLL
jgi:hypothetical protein